MYAYKGSPKICSNCVSLLPKAGVIVVHLSVSAQFSGRGKVYQLRS